MVRLLQPLPVLVSKSTTVGIGIRFCLGISAFFEVFFSILEIYKLLVDPKKLKLLNCLDIYKNLFGFCLVDIRRDLYAFLVLVQFQLFG